MNKLLLSGLLLICMAWSGVNAQWTQLTSDDLELPYAEAIVKHQGSWYIGTAGGVFKSTDNGLNWSLVNNNLYSVFNRLRIEGMASVGNTLLGTNRWNGIVLSTDGSSWSLPTSGLPGDYYMSELLGVVGSDVIALIQDNNTNDYSLYYSTDEGTTWTEGADLASANKDVYLYSADSKVFIVHENASGNDEFIGTTTNGQSVTAVPFTDPYPGTSIENIVKSGDHLIVFGESSIYRYDLINDGWTNLGAAWTNGIAFIAGSGNNTDQLYATILEGNMAIGAYTSDDHGDSWTTISPPLTTGKPFAMGIYAEGDEFMASFIDDGLHYTSDAGANIAQRNNGALATDFEYMVVSGDNILTSLFISGVYASSDDGANWSKWNTGLPTGALQHVSGFLSDGTSLFANFYDFPDEDPDPNKVLKSMNDGASWSELAFPGGQEDLELIGVNGNALYAYSTTGGDKYYTSVNGGDSWTEISGNIPSDFMVSKVTGDGTTAYLLGFETTSGNNHLRVYASTDNGATAWALRMDGINTGNLDEMNTDDDIHIVTPAPGVAFLHVRYQNWDNKLLRWNTNTWEAATANGMNSLDFQSLAYNDGVIYASSWNTGVYRSEDAGETFTEMDGLPDGLNAEIIDFKGDEVIISTHRGIWTYTETPTFINKFGDSNKILYPNPAKRIVYIGVDVNKVDIYSLSGQLVKSIYMDSNQFNIEELDKGIYLVVIRNATDKHTVKMIKH